MNKCIIVHCIINYGSISIARQHAEHDTVIPILSVLVCIVSKWL